MITIFVCNPRPESLTFRLLRKVQEAISAQQVEHQVIDIYKNNVPHTLTRSQAERYDDGVVFHDVKDVMEAMTKSDYLCFIFPVWMYGIPSPLKGLLEKVVRPDITFKITKEGVSPLLNNIKGVKVVCTSGQFNNFQNVSDDPVYYTFRELTKDNFGPECELIYHRLFGVDHLCAQKIVEFENSILADLNLVDRLRRTAPTPDS